MRGHGRVCRSCPITTATTRGGNHRCVCVYVCVCVCVCVCACVCVWSGVSLLPNYNSDYPRWQPQVSHLCNTFVTPLRHPWNLPVMTFSQPCNTLVTHQDIREMLSDAPDHAATNLMVKLLVLDPKKRLSAKEALDVCTYTHLMLLIHCCYTVVTLLLHCCYTDATLLLHCCYAVATLLLHCCYTVVTLLLHCWYTVVTLLLHCCHTAVTLLLHRCYTVVTPLLHCCYTVGTLL
jgi:hypothetical protein